MARSYGSHSVTLRKAHHVRAMVPADDGSFVAVPLVHVETGDFLKAPNRQAEQQQSRVIVFIRNTEKDFTFLREWCMHNGCDAIGPITSDDDNIRAVAARRGISFDLAKRRVGCGRASFHVRGPIAKLEEMLHERNAQLFQWRGEPIMDCGVVVPRGATTLDRDRTKGEDQKRRPIVRGIQTVTDATEATTMASAGKISGGKGSAPASVLIPELRRELKESVPYATHRV